MSHKTLDQMVEEAFGAVFAKNCIDPDGLLRFAAMVRAEERERWMCACRSLLAAPAAATGQEQLRAAYVSETVARLKLAAMGVSE